MSNENTKTTITFPSPSLLTIAFIVLKLVGVIDWNWIWVISPVWIMGIIWIIFTLLKLWTNKTNY